MLIIVYLLDVLVMSGLNMVYPLAIRISFTLKIVISMRSVDRVLSLVVRSMVFRIQKPFLRIIYRCNLNRQNRYAVMHDYV